MAASAETIQLLEALEAQEMLKLRGFAASCGDASTVVVDRWGHMRGLWRISSGIYVWIGGAYSQPAHRVTTVEDAVAYTLNVIAGA